MKQHNKKRRKLLLRRFVCLFIEDNQLLLIVLIRSGYRLGRRFSKLNADSVVPNGSSDLTELMTAAGTEAVNAQINGFAALRTLCCTGSGSGLRINGRAVLFDCVKLVMAQRSPAVRTINKTVGIPWPEIQIIVGVSDHRRAAVIAGLLICQSTVPKRSFKSHTFRLRKSFLIKEQKFSQQFYLTIFLLIFQYENSFNIKIYTEQNVITELIPYSKSRFTRKKNRHPRLRTSVRLFFARYILI